MATNKLVKVKVTVPPHIAAALKRGTGKATLAEAIGTILPVLRQPQTVKVVAKKKVTPKKATEKVTVHRKAAPKRSAVVNPHGKGKTLAKKTKAKKQGIHVEAHA